MTRCPHCNQPMPAPARRVRTCFDCKKPIARHDKWKWDERQGVLTAVHRHCGSPTSYDPPGTPKPVAPAPLFDGEQA